MSTDATGASGPVENGRNIALFLDGTWSDSNTNTNVVQICNRVPARAPGVVQERHYIQGVGVKVGERIVGGAFGVGVDDNIREGYQFITGTYRSDADRIFLFGYSRGAFCARSLAGMIAKCGLVPPGVLPVEAVYARYRNTDAPGLREMQSGERPARTAEDETILAQSRLARIRFIGVFDTVGDLGIPGGLGRLVNRRRFEFHDTNLSGLVDYACHAVALDEHRQLFDATLWTSVPIPIPGHPTRVEQRWFVGDHGNIGGGGTADPGRGNPLSVLTREWIADRARDAGLAVDPTVPASPAGHEWEGRIGNAFAGLLGSLSSILPFNHRMLRPVRGTFAQTLSPWVVERWGTGRPPYQPRNPALAPWVASLQQSQPVPEGDYVTVAS